jgi:Sulfotransferase domain
VKLIGAGLPRTATLSQQAALEILGLTPCHHMQEVFKDMTQVARWHEALDGRVSAAELLDGYEAMVDWPGSYYYRELMEAFPNAKVLLSVRDGDAWAKSMQETIWSLFYGDTLVRHLSDAQTFVDPVWKEYTVMMKEMWRRTALMNDQDTTLEYLSAAMERYNDEVKRTVPAERLLVWSPKDGWEPLCEFLELPVPHEALPHVNETDAFNEGFLRSAMGSLNANLGVVV